MDSQVNLSAAARGRTSSLRLRRIQFRTSEFLLVAGNKDILGFERSDRNPADRPSRNCNEWKRRRKSFLQTVDPAVLRDEARQAQ